MIIIIYAGSAFGFGPIGTSTGVTHYCTTDEYTTTSLIMVKIFRSQILHSFTIKEHKLLLLHLAHPSLDFNLDILYITTWP